MSGAVGRSAPAAGILHGLLICAGFYGLLGVAVLVGGPGAALATLLLVVVLLHGCLTSPRSASAPWVPTAASRRSALT